ncbi:MAG TPA: c-type cytochrome domain-containing protein [Terracidiphilus sp.]|jgi:WD40 repeat protein|nr:c-type cytochrome domain-containing protein [Terracidiphilus sp.]
MQDYPLKYRAIASTARIAALFALLPIVMFLPNHLHESSSHVMAASAPTFNDQIVPILQKNCLACHSSGVHKGGLSLDSYESLMKGGRHGQVIAAHDPSQSRLMQMVEGSLDPQMPLNADPLSPSDIAAIKSWITAGAEGPPSAEPAHVLTTAPIPDIRPQVAVTSPITAVKFSPVGHILAVGGYREIRLLNSSSGDTLATLAGHSDFVRSLAFSPDGKLLAAAGGSPQQFGEIKIWNVETHQLLRTIQGHKDCIYSVAWSPDGKLIASGSYDKLVKLWDAASGKETLTLQDHIDAVFAVAFSPDGKRLATASQDRTVKIWNVATGKRLYSLSDASDGLTSIAFSPTGDEIAAVGYDKTIYIWKLAEDDGQLIRSLIADEDSLLSLAWSPDGKSIVTSSSDRSIRFRDTSLNLTGVIDHQPDWVETLDLSPDGKWLAAGRYDGTLSLYDTISHKELRAQTTVFVPIPSTSDKNAKEAAGR